MHLPEFVEQLLDRVQGDLQLSLDGMTARELTFRPIPQANSMAWLAWHIARAQDVRTSHLIDSEQLWISDGWHARFGLSADPRETGRGHTDEQVATVRPRDAETLRCYCRAAHDRARAYVRSLPPDGARQVVASPEDGSGTTVGAILLRMVYGGLAHVGQLAYVRGLVERRRWFPR